MDLGRLGKLFRNKLRQIHKMEDREFMREIEWLDAQPRLSTELEKGLVKIFRDIGDPEEEAIPVSTWLDGLPLEKGMCLKNFSWRRVLGEGSYGKVFLVQDDAGTHYALKEIRLSSLGPRFGPKLKNEIMLMKKAGEAGIGPTLYDAYLCDNRLYLRMEYIAGQSLEQWVESHVLSERDRKTLLQVVERMHMLGIAHQDLHEGNIMVQSTPSGPVFRIIDYGFADTPATLLATERQQLRNMLQEIGSRDAHLIRRWAIYKLVASGHIKLGPSAATASTPRRKTSRRAA